MGKFRGVAGILGGVQGKFRWCEGGAKGNVRWAKVDAVDILGQKFVDHSATSRARVSPRAGGRARARIGVRVRIQSIAENCMIETLYATKGCNKTPEALQSLHVHGI